MGRTMLLKHLLEDAQQQEEFPKQYFGISSWVCPHKRNPTEFFMVGPYSTRAKAKAGAQRKLDDGQPRGFHDWSCGPIKFADTDNVKQTLTKLKLKVPQDLEDEMYSGGMVALYRLRPV